MISFWWASVTVATSNMMLLYHHSMHFNMIQSLSLCSTMYTQNNVKMPNAHLYTHYNLQIDAPKLNIYPVYDFYIEFCCLSLLMYGWLLYLVVLLSFMHMYHVSILYRNNHRDFCIVHPSRWQYNVHLQLYGWLLNRWYHIPTREDTTAQLLNPQHFQ